jgi:hypothetical protein
MLLLLAIMWFCRFCWGPWAHVHTHTAIPRLLKLLLLLLLWYGVGHSHRHHTAPPCCYCCRSCCCSWGCRTAEAGHPRPHAAHGWRTRGLHRRGGGRGDHGGHRRHWHRASAHTPTAAHATHGIHVAGSYPSQHGAFLRWRHVVQAQHVDAPSAYSTAGRSTSAPSCVELLLLVNGCGGWGRHQHVGPEQVHGSSSSWRGCRSGGCVRILVRTEQQRSGRCSLIVLTGQRGCS